MHDDLVMAALLLAMVSLTLSIAAYIALWRNLRHPTEVVLHLVPATGRRRAADPDPVEATGYSRYGAPRRYGSGGLIRVPTQDMNDLRAAAAVLDGQGYDDAGKPDGRSPDPMHDPAGGGIWSVSGQ